MPLNDKTPVVVHEQDEGKACVFVDPTGNPHAAIITRVWGPQCINVAYVALDQGEDGYGYKIWRSTSLMHRDIQQAHGNYWYFAEEDKAAA